MKKYLLIIIICSLLISKGIGQTYLYSNAMGNTGEDIGYGLTSDLTGYSWMTGAYNGTVDFGGGGLTSGGSDDIFLVKYNAVGAVQWDKSFGGPNIQIARSVTHDALGNTYITGEADDDIDFGGGNILTINKGLKDVFVAKLDVNGDYLWGKNLGSANNDCGLHIELDPTGNVYVVGKFEGSLTFASISYTGFGVKDGFIAKYDNSGNEIWFREVGGTANDIVNGLTIDDLGNIYITGEFEATGNFGATSIPTNGVADIFISRLKSDGSFAWTKTFGDTRIDKGLAIAQFGDKDIYITGKFMDNIDFGGGSGGLTAGGDDDIFLIKLDSLGAHTWSKNYGTSGHNHGNAVTTDTKGNVFLTGEINGPIDFGGGDLTHGGLDDIFSVGFTELGTHIFSSGFGGAAKEKGKAISINANDDVLITGSLESATNFGGGPESVSGGNDVFLYSANLSSLLPISNLEFQLAIEENKVNLEWIIDEAESATHSFEVEKSHNNLDFKGISIGNIMPSTIREQRRLFKFKDKKVSPGVYYYRLKIMDQTGGHTYSPTLQANVKMVHNQVMDIHYDFNNNTLITYIATPKNSVGAVTLTNFQGQVFKTFEVRGGDQLVIDMDRYPSNLYFLRFNSSQFTSIVKIMNP